MVICYVYSQMWNGHEYNVVWHAWPLYKENRGLVTAYWIHIRVQSTHEFLCKCLHFWRMQRILIGQQPDWDPYFLQVPRARHTDMRRLAYQDCSWFFGLPWFNGVIQQKVSVYRAYQDCSWVATLQPPQLRSDLEESISDEGHARGWQWVGVAWCNTQLLQ